MSKSTKTATLAGSLLGSILLLGAKCDQARTASDGDKISITNYVASLTNTLGADVTEIRPIKGNTFEVLTRSKSGAGGDLLTLQKQDGRWILLKKGVWME